MNRKTTSLRRLAAGAGVLALALAGVFGVSSAASAAQGADGTAPGNAPAGTTGTLVVHKYAGSTTGDTNNGTEQTIARPPLGGVEFTVCQVTGIDLTTSAGWTAAGAVTPATADCGANAPVVQTTAAGTGTASFGGLAIGLYLVTETATPDGVTAAAPFLVTVPYPSTSGSGEDATTTWLWTVHAYPKNTIEPTSGKTVEDPAAHGLGELVPWTITTRPIGSFDGGAPLTKYSIIDELVPNLQYNTTKSLQLVSPSGVKTTVDASWYSVNVVGSTVSVDFTATGLAAINQLPAGSRFEWVLDTKVVGVGVLDNKSFENTGGEDVQTGEADTDWGDAKLLKHETGNESAVLQGAEFQVYDVNADGTCSAPLEGSPLTVSGQSTFVSGTDGVVTIAGLYVGKNGETPSRGYCVVETKAPAGYVVDSTPKSITVTPGAIASGTYNLKVPNPPVKGPDLPLTGSTGTAMFIAGGAALILVAGGAALVMARRRTNSLK